MVYQPTVTLKSIRIDGVTVLPHQEIESLVEAYIGRPISTIDLQQLRYDLTLLYIDKGYITSGFIIPDQKVVDGSIYLQAIEGKLSEINVSGTKRLRKQYLADRLRDAAAPVLNVDRLKERLQLLNQGPLLDRVRGQLRPGERLGQAILDLEIEEAAPYRLDFAFDNARPPSVGAFEGTVHAAHLNLTGRGDAAEIFYSQTEGLEEVTGIYTVPVTTRDTTLSLFYQQSSSEVIEAPFNELDVESDYDGWGIALRHPFILTPTRSLYAAARLEHRRSKTFLLGEPFSFSPGVQNGESTVSVVRLSAEWLERSVRQAIAVRSIFSIGIDALDSTINKDAPDSRFFSWIGQFQWARRFGRAGYQAILRTDVQWTPDQLLPMEQFPVGGPYSVRGYRTNTLVRDNGLTSSFELRAPVLRSVPHIGALEVAAFVDYGRSWNADGGTPDPQDLSSIGLGLRWDPTPKLHTESTWAVPLRDIDYANYDLQNDGINFLVQYNFF